MKFRWFPLEKAVVLLCFLQNVLELPDSIVLPISLIVGTLSLKIEKARTYTPGFIVMLLSYTIRTFNDSPVLRNFELVLEILLFYAFVVTGVFEIPQQFEMYEKFSSGEKMTNVGYMEHANADLDICIYYPTSDNIEGKPQAGWYPRSNYAKIVYEKVFINPRIWRIIPRWLFEFCLTYLTTYKQHAYLDTTL